MDFATHPLDLHGVRGVPQVFLDAENADDLLQRDRGFAQGLIDAAQALYRAEERADVAEEGDHRADRDGMSDREVAAHRKRRETRRGDDEIARRTVARVARDPADDQAV